MNLISSLSRFCGNEWLFRRWKRCRRKSWNTMSKQKFEPQVVWCGWRFHRKVDPSFLILTSQTEHRWSENYLKPVSDPVIVWSSFIDNAVPKWWLYFNWPDLASAHYAKDTLQFLLQWDWKSRSSGKRVKSSRCSGNSSDREIVLLAHLKLRVYEGGWEAKNAEHTEESYTRKTGYFQWQVLLRSLCRNVSC